MSSLDEIFNELKFLATVEHALIVEYLSIQCAVGHDLEPDQGGPTSDQGRAAAGAAAALAQNEMYRLKGLNRVLASGGASAPLDRAASISSTVVGEIEIGPPTLDQLAQLVERGNAIASAVDDRYSLLRSLIGDLPESADGLVEELGRVIDDGMTHTADFRNVEDALRGVAPMDVLRATRRQPADTFESRLLAVSDRSYATLLWLLGWAFGQSDLTGEFRLEAVDVMTNSMDEVNRLLVQRGLLPPFSIG